MRKQIVGLLGAASIAAAALIADAPTVVAAPAAEASAAGHVSAAASSRGGKVSRKEVISRAKYWYKNRSKIKYSGTGTYRDPDSKKHLYRRDCSGYVDMALHLSSGPNTVSLPSYGVKLKSRKDMKMGDFTGILGSGTGGSAGHVRIFEKWKSKKAGTYYAYDFGSTPVKHAVYTLSKDKSRKGTDGKYHGWTAYRYKKIA
jgi:DNA-binding transcriptional regulator YdaS (Cro superfamily)